MTSPILKHSVVIAGHKTSISLEAEFFAALKEIAGERRSTLSALIGAIDQARGGANLSSALRTHVIAHYRDLLRTADSEAA